jgi:hypothetical protein
VLGALGVAVELAALGLARAHEELDARLCVGIVAHLDRVLARQLGGDALLVDEAVERHGALVVGVRPGAARVAAVVVAPTAGGRQAGAREEGCGDPLHRAAEAS